MLWSSQTVPALTADPLPLSLGLFLLLLAPALGSFLGVLVDRLPRDEDVLRAPSRCRKCQSRLRVRDLVPILSFVWRRGRCRYCAASIPPWCLYLEIIATGIVVLALAAGGTGLTVLFSCLFLWCLLALAVCDLLWLRLPDALTLALAAVVAGSAALAGGTTVQCALLGAGLGVGSFWGLRFSYQKLRGREGLGLGDVKLMAGLGGFAGPFDLSLLVLIAALLVLCAALLSRGVAGRGMTGKAIEPGAETLGQQALPFGSGLCAAAAVIWLLRALAILPV